MKIFKSRILLKNGLRYFSTNNKIHKVTLFRGDGIGPEISQSVVDIFKSAGVPIEWEEYSIYSKAVTDDGDLISKESLESILRNKIALKGPFTTPIGGGYRSLNVTLRKKLKLYANVRPVKSIKGVQTVYEDVDLVTIRENTEGEYSGLEHEVIPGVVENLKIISEDACSRIAQFAFQYAVNNKRKSVCAAHKAGVQYYINNIEN
jgi:isocitrate dehydrogenase (NAD+)